MAIVDRMFMIAVDPLGPGYDTVKLKQLLHTDKLFTAWWHHIRGCFLVTSQGTADEITDRFMAVTGNARLLVIEVNPRESEGCLPPESWQWLQRRETEHASQDSH